MQKRNLTGGFNGFDWNDKKSRFIAKTWRDLSNQEELILQKIVQKTIIDGINHYLQF